MIHVKRGRGPSFMGGVFGIIFAIVAFFMFLAVNGDNQLGATAPGFFKVVPLLFVFIGIGSAIYNFYNAGARHRVSELDITTSGEEPDPINEAVLRRAGSAGATPATDTAGVGGQRKFPGEFCPFCGDRVKPEFAFCPKCGKDI